MATLRDIRRRINGVSGTAKITQAMYMVSSAKLRRAQESIWSARPYIKKLDAVLSNLIRSLGEDYTHTLIENRKEIKSLAIIIIASDKGMCGSFNTNLLRKVINFVNDEMPMLYPNATAKFILVGKRSLSGLKINNPEIFHQAFDIFQNLNFATAKDIIELTKNGFFEGQFDKVTLFFNEFKNLLSQVPRQIDLLPFTPTIIDEEKGKYNIDYIFEPEKKQIIDELLPKSIEIQFWRTLLESNAAEQAARRMAMDNATKNANDLVKQLELQFNKERQAAITTEMLEIVGGANALKKS